ncbi:MAG: 6,7-dimethyl-8-ribityllumazine synthase [Bacteroidota bacterium]|nr:6,7-dimethyl-8-ribityllumazine synthase [Bacteroidota bacterium]
MSSSNQNLSDFSFDFDASAFTFGIVVSKWNSEITNSLLNAAIETLHKSKVPQNQIIVLEVPGTFELPFGAQKLAEKQNVDAVICLGCVVQGETRHFDFICDAAANGVMRVSLDYKKPVTFGVLTTNDMQQAIDRSGGKYGNKGVEAAITAVQLLA